MSDDMNIDNLLEYYMGKNTPERQDFIVENLRIEEGEIDDAIEIEEAFTHLYPAILFMSQ